MRCVAFRQARHVKIETATAQSFRKDSKAPAGRDSFVTEIGNNCIPWRIKGACWQVDERTRKYHGVFGRKRLQFRA